MSSRGAPLFLGDLVPDFEAPTQLGPIQFHAHTRGSWCVFFSHPKDFTPVCTTEIAAVAKMQDEFRSRNAKVIGLSIDSLESHAQFIKEINESQEVAVNFPIIADEDGSVANSIGMVSSTGSSGVLSTRWLYVVDPEHRLQLSFMYPAATGRNFHEVLRSLDSLKLTADMEVGTPANWQKGEDIVILPSLDDEAAGEKFPKGFTSIKPYLRITPQPDADAGAGAGMGSIGESGDEDEDGGADSDSDEEEEGAEANTAAHGGASYATAGPSASA